MHREYKPKKSTVVTIALTALLVLCGGIAFALSQGSSSTNSETAVTFITPPPSADDIAVQMNCANFNQLDISATAHALGVVDGGTCWMDGSKYAIDTFKNSANRDAWLKISEPFGVNPEWETATSVTYPSIG
jgi:hypothetical protein